MTAQSGAVRMSFLSPLCDTSVGGIGQKQRAEEIPVVVEQAKRLYHHMRCVAECTEGVNAHEVSIVLHHVHECFIATQSICRKLSTSQDDEFILIMFSQFFQLSRTARFFGFEFVQAHYLTLLLPEPQLNLQLQIAGTPEVLVISERENVPTLREVL